MRLNAVIPFVGFVLLSLNAFANESILIEPLSHFVEDVVKSLGSVPMERQEILSTIADYIIQQLKDGQEARLVFVCTHNSRRSHLAQIWCECAATYYEIPGLKSYSGGTEATACNIRTVRTLRRAGFSVVATTDGVNPVYLIQYSESKHPIPTFSKLYSDESNPAEDFAAVMCCSEADGQCPVVKGSAKRFPLHFEDPKTADNTKAEATAYDQRCFQVAQEMFFVMSEVSKRLK